MSLKSARGAHLAPVIYVVSLAVMTVCAACNVDDTGDLCQSPNVSFVADPIVGESPVVEVVNLTRDANCLQFSCLTAQGLPSYCTHGCRYDVPAHNAAACVSDSDCKLPQHCHDNVCNDDNCPPGFFCEIPEATGSLGSTPYCMRQTGCSTNPDCGDVAHVSCTTVGCYDSCLNTAQSCTLHRRICAPISTLRCTCADGSASCADSELTCQPEGAPAPFAAGAVAQQGMCLPKN
jgi:hypothetical protein